MIPKTNGTNVKSGPACPDRLPRLPCLPCLARLSRLPPGEDLARLPSSLPAGAGTGAVPTAPAAAEPSLAPPRTAALTKTGSTAPELWGRCLPGANQGPTAPGNVENRLSGAKRPVFAPGREEIRSPGAETGPCAPGNAKKFVVRSGGKQGCRAGGLSWARVFPRGPISARGKHGHPAGLFHWGSLFPSRAIHDPSVLPSGVQLPYDRGAEVASSGWGSTTEASLATGFLRCGRGSNSRPPA